MFDDDVDERRTFVDGGREKREDMQEGGQERGFGVARYLAGEES